MNLFLFNTLTRKKEKFTPLHDNKVGLYTCGPTVYNFAHIGNLRTYFFADTLKRTLLANNFKVKQVINITDVGHLTSDADVGEDKIEKGAQREGKTVWEIAEFYTQAFKNDLKQLHILPPTKWCKATAHLKEQIALIKTLEKKGFTYRLADGIYFDTSKLSDYGKLARLDKAGLKAGARIEMVVGKRNTTDFALWKFSPSTSSGGKRQMEWESPWGTGFPGWHIECSAMSVKYLGQPFDIHTGGVDHIAIHHTNEIAQSEAATGKPLANFWLHGEFLLIDEGRMGKSVGNFITLKTLIDKGFDPLSYRYLCLTAHYRSKLNFTWESLAGAEQALNKLRDTIRSWKHALSSVIPSHSSVILNHLSVIPHHDAGSTTCVGVDSRFRGNDGRMARDDMGGATSPAYYSRFLQLLDDDLNTPKTLAYIWDLLKENPSPDILATILAIDKVHGLGLDSIKPLKIPATVKKLAEAREQARLNRNWAKSDELREKIRQKGYTVDDSPQGPIIKVL